MDKYLKKITWVFTIILSLYFIYLICTPINLHTADLGRHLKNGEIILNQHFIPSTNLYAYTATDYPFVNHHWGTGVIFYLLYQLFGFPGLTFWFAVFSLITFLLFLHLSLRYSNLYITLPFAILAIPPIAFRSEIRPEVFSYLFIALFFWILLNVTRQKMNQKWLFLLPVLELFWVNIHIYFPFGLLLIAIFAAEKIIQWLITKSKNDLKLLKTLVIMGVLSGGVTLLNPFGLTGVLYPLHIFDNYGYRVLENQSVSELDRLISYPPTPFFKALLALLGLSWIATFIPFKFKNWLQEGNLALLILTILFSVMSWNAVRNFAVFAYFAMTISSINLKNLNFQKLKVDQSSAYFFYPLIVIAVFLFTLFASPKYWEGRPGISFGTYPGTDASIQFFQQNNLKGPIFNNYDNGGFLTFYLYPQEKVFVDNRPEAYPQGFFQNTYIAMQNDPKVFEREDQKYHFNVIFFYRRDLTNWGQKFLVDKIQDPTWSPVYVDQFAIIFLKNNAQNAELIKKYKLPPEMFKVRRNE